jgi:hypothetical protein
MKSEWKEPMVEILDISKTMKGWNHDHGGGHHHDDDCEHGVLDS